MPRGSPKADSRVRVKQRHGHFSEIVAQCPLFTPLGSLLEDEEAVLVAERHRAATVAARHATPRHLGRASGAAPRGDATLP